MKKMRSYPFLLVLISCIIFSPSAGGQDTTEIKQVTTSSYSAKSNVTYLLNPSFEGKPQRGMIQSDKSSEFLEHWIDCEGAENGHTPPDVHSAETNNWAVTHIPSDKKTYISMVYREDGTYEVISQKLQQALTPESCYTFSIDLAQSPEMKSPTKSSRGSAVAFIEPIKLQIYGSDELCGRSYLLYESPFIDHEEWKTYSHTFLAEAEFHSILLKTYYKGNILESANGNLLLDNMKDFVLSDCEAK